MTKNSIGLLPLFLDLYDAVLDNEQVKNILAFTTVIEEEYKSRNIEVVVAPTCRKHDQFHTAIKQFENADIDAIVTLHLAYSPSLEAIEAIKSTYIPLIILDTTPDSDFGFKQKDEKILFNHGIHGVQDLCNLLIRNNRPFNIEVGHWKKSNVIDRTITILQGCRAAKELKQARVGIIGTPFEGMGDFAVEFDILKNRIGIDVISTTSEKIARLMPAPDSEEIKSETQKDLTRFTKGEFSEENLIKTEAAGLAVRNWIEQENLSAFTMNFGDITGAPGLPVVPFMEASKAMAHGIGYGGEGDVLTAAFCGAIAKVIPDTTFTEMFCPDWDGDRIFMSHMGEMNINLTTAPPVLEQRPYPFSEAEEPIIAAGCLKSGSAWLLNVAPSANNTFSLVTAPVEVCDTNDMEKIHSGIRGWIKPQISIADFLKRYSMNGGTHHCVISYGINEQFIEAFAKTMNWKLITIS